MNPQDLFRQHAQLRQLARAIVGESYADDVTQEVWAAALGRSGPAPRNPDAWLSRIVRNLAWKSRLGRARARDREVDRANLGLRRSSEVESPEALIAEVEEKHALERSVLALEEPYRSAILWRYYGGLTVAEVASRTGHNASTVRTHVARGVEHLRRRLEREGGADWRAGLMPLLGRGLDLGGRELAAPGALTSSGQVMVRAGTSGPLVALLKVAAAAAVLLLAGYSLTPVDEGNVASPAPSLAAASAPPAIPESPLSEVQAALTRTAASDPAPGLHVAAPATLPPQAVGKNGETTVLVIEPSSGKPLAGVEVNVRYAYMKRRGWFTSSTAFATVRIETDAFGRATIPVETDHEGLSASNALSATVRTNDQAGAVVHLLPGPSKNGGVLELRLVDAYSFRVRLPEALTREEHGALAATVVKERASGGFTDARIYRPVRVEGRDLTFVIAQARREHPGRATTLHLATTDQGRSFHANVPPKVNLATEPLKAILANDVIHSFRVVHGVTGEPIAEQNVGVGRPAESQPYACYEALGRTDGDGLVKLIGIPAGEVAALVRVESFQDFRAKMIPVAGGTTEVRLIPRAGLRSVRLRVQGPGADAPPRVDVKVMTNDRLSTTASSLTLSPAERPGGGWFATGVLEHIPSETCFLEAMTIPGNYDTVGPIRIEPGEDEVRVLFGPVHDLTSVRLRLPPQVQAEYQQRAGKGRLYGSIKPYSDGDIVGTVEDDDRPVTWIVTAPGYVPVVGNRDRWRRLNEDGKRLIEITPNLQRGWGALIRAQSNDWDRSVPFHFRKAQPIAGVTIFDCATGKTLGLTDETGYAVITAAKPIQEIGARYGEKTKTFDLKGGLDAQFGF